MRVSKIYNFQYSIFKKKRAFTLVEIVVVIAILGIIISGILSVFLNVITTQKSGEYYSRAYKDLDNKIESLRATPFASITAGNFAVSDLPGGNGNVSVSTNIDGSPQTDIMEATVTINWTFKKNFQVKAVTYIAKGGLK